MGLGRRAVLGVDGGGSSTSCVVLDLETQEVLGSGSAGCSNKNMGAAAAEAALQAAVQAALEGGWAQGHSALP